MEKLEQVKNDNVRDYNVLVQVLNNQTQIDNLLTVIISSAKQYYEERIQEHYETIEDVQEAYPYNSYGDLFFDTSEWVEGIISEAELTEVIENLDYSVDSEIQHIFESCIVNYIQNLSE